jgi:hypothetical protein
MEYSYICPQTKIHHEKNIIYFCVGESFRIV